MITHGYELGKPVSCHDYLGISEKYYNNFKTNKKYVCFYLHINGCNNTKKILKVHEKAAFLLKRPKCFVCYFINLVLHLPSSVMLRGFSLVAVNLSAVEYSTLSFWLPKLAEELCCRNQTKHQPV